MWADIDFFKLDITFNIDNLLFRLVDAKHTLFINSFPNHIHSFYELHYICGGKGTLIIKDGNFDLKKNTIYLIGPKTDHEQLTDNNDYMEEYSFSFEVFTNKNKCTRSFADIIKHNGFWIGTDEFEIPELFKKIEPEAVKKRVGYIYVIKNYFEQIILSLLRNMHNQVIQIENNDNIPDDRRKFIIDETFIYQHKDITLTSLAEILSLSERQTSRIIKKEYGVSFSELRVKSRLDAAASLLLTNRDMKINKISENVGFASQLYFARLFKNYFSVSPSEYRKL